MKPYKGCVQLASDLIFNFCEKLGKFSTRFSKLIQQFLP